MFRWPLTVIGVLIIGLGFMIAHKHPPLPEDAEVMTIHEASLLVHEDERRYIDLQDAKADTARVVFSAYTQEPLYTLMPTDQEYDLTGVLRVPGFDMAKYVGCFVKVADQADDRYGISLRVTSEDKKTEKKEVLEERRLVPLKLSDGHVWALSKVYRKGDVQVGNWAMQSQYAGVLSFFSNLNDNAGSPELDFTWKEIQEFAQKEFNVAPKGSDYVILTDNEPSDRFCLFPVKHSMNTLFVIGAAGKRATNNMIDSITGILEPSPIDWYADLPILLGEAVPNRIGIITDETAAAYNKRFAGTVKGTKVVGAVLLAVGGLGQALHAFRRKT